MGHWRLAFVIVCGTLAVAACGTLLAVDDTPAVPDAGGLGSGAVECDGQKFDLASDPAHCGNCGRRCSSGTCSGGVCPSETVRDELSAPRGIVTDETRIAFIESGPFVDGGGGVWVGDLDNGVPKDLHVVASESGSQVAFHEGEILWASDTPRQVRRTAIDCLAPTCRQTAAFGIASTIPVSDLRVRGHEGVWLETGFGGVAHVTLLPLVANGFLASSFDFPGAPAQVAVEGRQIFIAAGDAGVRMVEDCDAAFSRSCARDVATTPAIAVAAAPDGAVYFLDRGGDLRRASPVRFELTTVVSAGRGAHGLRLIGSELYLARTDDRPGATPEGGGSEIVRIGVDGTCPGARQCPQPVLRVAGGTIRALAVNQARVFATVTDVASERGRVLSAPR